MLKPITMITKREQQHRQFIFTLLLIFILSAAFLNPNRLSLAQSGSSSQVYIPLAQLTISQQSISGPQVYWGAWIDGEQYGLGDAPWVDQTIDTFESHAGKKISILHWGQAWHWNGHSGYSGIGDGYFQKFETPYFENVRQRGTIPMISWNSWELTNQSKDNPDWQLIDIISGSYDAYITQWAKDAKAWGKPFFLRFNHEMNGDWYPWSEQENGNKPGEYVLAWRHVHDIFIREGADNATWVWTVNVEYASNPESSNLENYYPGDAYVDWVAMDGYNWGPNLQKKDVWKTFSQVFSQTYNHLLQVAPSRPIMIAEFASTENGGSKADWITDALVTQIPSNFPQIKAVLCFNRNDDGMDWIIETSPSAQNAFAEGIASSFYSANDFAGLASSPVSPLSSLPSFFTHNQEP
jgi:beta-mannanase